MDQITLSDLALLTEAQAAVNQAQVIVQFAQSHISKTYKIVQGDSVDTDTGVITRAAVPNEV